MKYSAGWWLQQLCTLSPREPLTSDAQEGGGNGTKPSEPLPYPIVLPPNPSNLQDQVE